MRAVKRSLDKAVGPRQARVRSRCAGADPNHRVALDDSADVDLVVEAVVEELTVKRACSRPWTRSASQVSCSRHDILTAGDRCCGHATAGRRGAALLQPGSGHVAGRGGSDDVDGLRLATTVVSVPSSSVTPRSLRRPRRLHRQPLLFPYLNDAVKMLGPLREGRRHRRGDEARLRPAHGPVRVARRDRPRRHPGDPA